MKGKFTFIWCIFNAAACGLMAVDGKWGWAIFNALVCFGCLCAVIHINRQNGDSA